MRPAARQRLLKKRTGDLFSTVCLSFHVAYARRPASDVHGRGVPSRDVFIRRVPAETAWCRRRLTPTFVYQ
jgi:hypothetical protein